MKGRAGSPAAEFGGVDAVTLSSGKFHVVDDVSFGPDSKFIFFLKVKYVCLYSLSGISMVHIINSVGTGIGIPGTPLDVSENTFKNNDFVECDSAISIENSDGNEIKDNKIRLPTGGNGISLFTDAASNTSDGNQIVQNTIFGEENTGQPLRGAGVPITIQGKQNFISDNAISGGAPAGVVIQSNSLFLSTQNKIVDNTISLNTFGVEIRFPSSNTVVASNVFVGIRNKCISTFESAGTVLSDNQCDIVEN